MSAKPLAAPLLMPVQCNPTYSDVTAIYCHLDLDLDLVALDLDSDLDLAALDPKTRLLMPVCNPTYSDVTLHCNIVSSRFSRLPCNVFLAVT